jgi:predicted RNA-binding protein YlqC (UPF0109 family)
MLIKLIENLVKKLVEDTSKVRVTKQESNANKITINIFVAQTDVSRIIGNNGRTFRAIKTIGAILSPKPLEIIVDNA